MHDWLGIRPATLCDRIGGRKGWLARLSVHSHSPSHKHDMQILRYINTNVCIVHRLGVLGGSPYYSYNQAHLVSLITQTTSKVFTDMVQYSAECSCQGPVPSLSNYFGLYNFVLLDLAFTCIILFINITSVLGNIGKGMQYIYIM